MTLSNPAIGDIVRCNVKGREFLAFYAGRLSPGSTHVVDPIQKGITYHHVTSREIRAHWRKSKASS